MSIAVHAVSIVLILLRIAFGVLQYSVLPEYDFHISFVNQTWIASRIVTTWCISIILILQLGLQIFLLRKKRYSVRIAIIVLLILSGLAYYSVNSLFNSTRIREMQSAEDACTILEENHPILENSELKIYQRINWFMTKDTGIFIANCWADLQYEWLAENIARITVPKKCVLYKKASNTQPYVSIPLEANESVLILFDYENSKIITEEELAERLR